MITGTDVRKVATFLSRFSGEASTRAQIGRLYYAAFIDARHMCQYQFEFTPTGGGEDHDLVRRCLRDQARDPVLSENLLKLRIMRNKADYRESLPHERQLLKESMALATKISEGISGHGGRSFM